MAYKDGQDGGKRGGGPKGKGKRGGGPKGGRGPSRTSPGRYRGAQAPTGKGKRLGTGNRAARELVGLPAFSPKYGKGQLAAVDGEWVDVLFDNGRKKVRFNYPSARRNGTLFLGDDR